MKKILILIGLTLFNFSSATAVSLYEALNQTYQNNIQLNAERQNIKTSEDDVNISKAGYRPSLTITGSKSFENTNQLTDRNGDGTAITDVDPITTSIKLEQKVIDLGRDLILQKNIVGLDLSKAQFCLLYTSPSPRDGLLSRMPSSA